MSTFQRPVDLPNELVQILHVADVSGLNIPHVADWPYRFSSWGTADPLNTRAWLDTSSNLLGWVVLQTPFWAIDCVVHPGAPQDLYREMLEWSQVRAAELVAEGKGRPMWFVSIPTTCLTQRAALVSLGFKDVSDWGDDSWSKVLFELADDNWLSPVALPNDLRIRSLDTSSEIQAYVDMHREVFQSESMTYEWRKKATIMSDYINALDLVISSEKGELYGFCVAWLRHLATGETVGQIEPLGVRESHRGQKFSRQLMTGAIRRLRELGASRIFVETDRQRDSAMAAYHSMGFQIAHEVLVYRHDIPK